MTRILFSSVKAKKYDVLKNVIESIPPLLMDHEGKRRNGDNEKRIDGHAILSQYEQDKVSGTFLQATCDILLSTGDRAKKVHVDE